jgi:hypothetical protein
LVLLLPPLLLLLLSTSVFLQEKMKTVAALNKIIGFNNFIIENQM